MYTTGSISAKIAIAIAKTLGLDPFYLTGDAEDQGEFTDEALKSFLSAKGYEELVKKATKPQRKQRQKDTPEAKAAALSAPAEFHEPQKEPEQPEPKAAPDYSAMTEDETLQLIRSLFIQEKYSENAGETLKQIKSLLVK